MLLEMSGPIVVPPGEWISNYTWMDGVTARPHTEGVEIRLAIDGEQCFQTYEEICHGVFPETIIPVRVEVHNYDYDGNHMITYYGRHADILESAYRSSAMITNVRYLTEEDKRRVINIFQQSLPGNH